MKTIKLVTGFILFFCLLSAVKATARERAAFCPLEPSGSKSAADATRYLTGAIGHSYQIFPTAKFQSSLKQEMALKPDIPAESFYRPLAKDLDVDYVISGKVAESAEKVKYEISVLDVLTNRSRVFSREAETKKSGETLQKMGSEIVNYMRNRDRLLLYSERDSDIARAILKKLPKGKRPPISVAITEKIAGEPSSGLFAETALLYYLDSCGFPVKSGETALLREYSDAYFANRPWEFPITLTAGYYIIGTASAEPGTNQSGPDPLSKSLVELKGAKARMEVRVLDREGKVLCGKKVTVESTAFSIDAAEARALKAAASEIAVEILPLLKY
jgi:hypothetical protein